MGIGFGWLVAIFCILKKFDKDKDGYPCLANDLVKITFSSITLVAVAGLYFSINIYSREMAGVIGSQEDVAEVQSKVAEDQGKVAGKVGELVSSVEDLMERKEDIRNDPVLLMDEIERLEGRYGGGMSGDDVFEVVRRHFGFFEGIDGFGISFHWGDRSVECNADGCELS